MKKIFIILFLLVSATCFSQILDFEYEFEVGWIPQNGWILYNPTQSDIYSTVNLYTNFEAELLFFDLIFVGGGMRNTFFYAGEGNSIDFSPYEMYFNFTLGLKTENFEIGYRHMCAHPLIAYAHPEQLSNRIIEGSYDELYIKFKGKVNIF